MTRGCSYTLACLAWLVACHDVRATHFRFGNLSWVPTTTPGEVEFKLTLALRRDSTTYGAFPGGVDQYAETGDIIVENVGGTDIAFGDGTADTPTLQFIVTAFSTNDNWLIGEALNPGTTNRGVRHLYTGTNSSSFLAGLNSCCRMGTTELNNRPDGTYILRSVVKPHIGNRSPIAALLPIVNLPSGAMASFGLPAFDPDGDPLRYRLANDGILEAGSCCGPTNLSINPTNGLVTWNTIGLNSNRFWTAQVIVEDIDTNGPSEAVKSTSVIDFLLRIGAPPNQPPVLEITPPGPITVHAGSFLNFLVSASDPNTGDSLTLITSGLPSGATSTPPLPVIGQASGVSAVIHWTPDPAQVGLHVISFTVLDTGGTQLNQQISVNVVGSPFITQQPSSQIAYLRSDALLHVLAVGTPPLGYQWLKDGTNLLGANASDLLLTNVQLTASGQYSVVVTNQFGSITSDVATVFVVIPTFEVNLGTNGYGSVSIDPVKTLYELDDVVQITAMPARWHRFSYWSDGNTNSPRAILISSNVTITAVFLPETPLEFLTFGGISRLAPVGMPAVLVDGVFIVESNVSVRGSAVVSLSTTFPNGTMLFTLDGSDPDFSAALYEEPFVMRQSATLRAVAYNADFTQSVQSDPVEIVILPTLSATTAGGGTVAVDPPGGTYHSNGTATVTATPAPGWTFLHWLGDATGMNPVATVDMARNRCVEAVFGMSLSNTVVGSGSVARSPAAALYPYGTTVRLTALPAAGNYFALWGNAASGTNHPLNFVVTNANATVTAVFAALPGGRHALAVRAESPATVDISPRANHYASGASVTLTALPAPGQTFLGWGGSVVSTANPLTLTMDASKLITANFTPFSRLEVLTCGGASNGEAMQVLLRGEFDRYHVIEAATTLAPGAADWTPLGIFAATHGVIQVNDPFVTNRTQRFYRATPAP